MIDRTLAPVIKKQSMGYPVVGIVGPRQSGKTTLTKTVFHDYAYVNLENMDIRNYAIEDPRGFLKDNPAPIIIDEAQRAPELFSYLQEIADSISDPHKKYILTGSQQFLLFEKITQSLAGRIINFKLFPFTFYELNKLPYILKGTSSLFSRKNIKGDKYDLYALILSGSYPRIHDKQIDSHKWIENYIITYIEKDVRQITNVLDLRTFEMFIKVLASYSGKVVNYASIANTIGVSLPTIKKWISIMETSGLIFLLSPHHKNFNKRIIKSPKLYFADTGILCFLLSIKNEEQLKYHPFFGNIFETFIISEAYKRLIHIGEIPSLYFFCDKTGNEIDIIHDTGELFPVEIKSSVTYSNDFSKNIKKWMSLPENTQSKGLVIYRGDQVFGSTDNIMTLPWWAW